MVSLSTEPEGSSPRGGIYSAAYGGGGGASRCGLEVLSVTVQKSGLGGHLLAGLCRCWFDQQRVSERSLDRRRACLKKEADWAMHVQVSVLGRGVHREGIGNSKKVSLTPHPSPPGL